MLRAGKYYSSEGALVMAKGRSAMRVRVEPVVLHQDGRGSVFEPLDSERLPNQRNIHVVVTEPGCVRGNHYHTQGTEVVTVQGPALVRIRDKQGIQETRIPEGKVTRYTIPPGVAHAVQNLGSRPTLLVSFRDLTHDPKNPDVVREILIEA
jgi:dTDP-4-dehydrorhamnose 3,5-epimerase-like enzyme